ncbi:MAG: autotransporter-associated beta strand repeat-containing protein [Planctomycetaceae bacterium]|nr:autotransporter-associated beta strand repeat-containing protein [Planctomycetaceae bacterium]
MKVVAWYRRCFLGLALPVALAAIAIPSSAWSQINKETTGTDLTVGASWVGGVAPGSGDVATWASGTALGGALTMSSNQSWQGIDIQGATSAVTTSGAGTLTIGTSGINVAASGVNLTLGNARTFGDTSSIAVGSGRTVALSGGTTTFASGTTTTIGGDGILSLAGTNHTLTGDGALVISGGNLYNDLQSGSSSATRTGSTTLGSGIIRISTSVSMFGTGAINLNGGTIGSHSTTGRDLGSSNAVSIGGNFQIGGTGVLGNGYVRFGGGTDLGSSVRTITVVANGVFSGNGQGAIFSGKVTGSGGIVKEGTGTMTLSNNTNDYSGATTINNGNLAISQKALANSSSVTLANSAWLLLGENSAGTHDINNLSGSTNTIIRSDFSLSGTAVARTLRINQTVNGEFAGSILHNASRPISIEKTGNGTLTLSGSGANNNYTGSTTVSAGTLLVNGTHNAANVAYTVKTGATLGGNGTIGTSGANVTIESGGTLAAGNSIGALTINGNLTVGGAFQWEVQSGTSNADLVDVLGNVDLTGSTLSIVQLGTFQVGQSYTVLAYDGTLTGTFSGFNTSLWTIDYAAGSAGLNGGVGISFVTLTAVPEPSALLFVGATVATVVLRRRRRA